jgi:hypothetical protein
VNAFRRSHGRALANATVTIEGKTKKLYEIYRESFDGRLAELKNSVDEANAAYEAAKAKFSTSV